MDPHLTYLKFAFNNTSGAQAYQLDGSAHSFIKRLRVTSKSGGFDLENINEYGNLYNMLADIQLGTAYRMGAGAIAEGFGVDNDSKDPCHVESAIANGSTQHYCIPIMSSIIGQMNNKYLPLFLTGDIQLEIELHARPFINTTGPNASPWTVNGVELHTQYIEFSSEVNNTLRAIASTSGLYIHATTWKYFPAVCTGTQNNNFLINERLRSVKSLLFGFRSNIANNGNILRNFGRGTNLLKDYQLKVGQTLYPTQAIRASDVGDYSEFITETMKSVGCYANSHNAGVITPTNYITNTLAVIGAVLTPGRAVFGLDLDAFTKQNIESGVNTILDNPLTLMTTHTGPEVALNCDIYLLHDIILVLQSNGEFLVSK